MSEVFVEGNSTVIWRGEENPSVPLSSVSLDFLLENGIAMHYDSKGTFCFNFMTSEYLFRGPFFDKGTSFNKLYTSDEAVRRAKICKEILGTKNVSEALGSIVDKSGYLFLVYPPIPHDQSYDEIRARLGTKFVTLKVYRGDRYITLQKAVSEFAGGKRENVKLWLQKESFELLKGLVALYCCNVTDIAYRDGVLLDTKVNVFYLLNLDKSSKIATFTTDVKKCESHFYLSYNYGRIMTGQLDSIVVSQYGPVASYYSKLVVNDEKLNAFVTFSSVCLETHAIPLPQKREGYPNLEQLLDPTEVYLANKTFRTTEKVRYVIPMKKEDTKIVSASFINPARTTAVRRQRREISETIKDRPQVDIGGTVSNVKLGEYYTYSSDKRPDEKYKYTIDVIKNALQIYIRKGYRNKALMCTTELWKTGALSGHHYHLFQAIIKTAYEDLAHRDNSNLVNTVVQNCDFWRKTKFERIPIEQVFNIVVAMCNAKKSREPIWLDEIYQSKERYQNFSGNTSYPELSDAESIYDTLQEKESSIVQEVERVCESMIHNQRNGEVLWFKIALVLIYLEDNEAFFWMHAYLKPTKDGIQSALDIKANSPVAILFSVIDPRNILKEYKASMSVGSGSAKRYSTILYLLAIQILKYSAGVPIKLGDVKPEIPKGSEKYVDGQYDLVIDDYVVNSDTVYGKENYKASTLRELDRISLETKYDPEEQELFSIAEL